MEPETIFRWVFAGAGGVMALVGGLTFAGNLRLLTRGRRATGSLVGWKQETGFDPARRQSTTYHHPVVRFHAADGSEHQIVGSGHGRKPSWPMGRPIPIRYDPADPDQATFVSFFGSLLVPLLIAVIGVGMFWVMVTL